MNEARKRSYKPFLQDTLLTQLKSFMIDFGVVQAEHGPNKILGERYRELAAFEITRFGKSLLKSMDDIQ